MADPNERPVSLTPSGPPTTVLPADPPELRHALAQALSLPHDGRLAAVSAIVAGAPRFLDGWARLGELLAEGSDPVRQISAYAAFRVGYHRGLDTLRANGWRGSGYVRWRNETNRGFLRALRGLGAVAARIGEADEAERIRLFLEQLDPGGVPADG